MGLLDRILGNKKEEAKTTEIAPKPKIEPKVVPQEDTLDLGWYWSETQNEAQMAKIKEKDRRTHLYVVGASGAGKSKFLEFLLRQDILNRKGFGLIDPHGDLVEEIKGFLALSLSKEEIEARVVYVDPASVEYTIAFNPLEKTEGISPAEIAAELIEAFKKIWFDSWGARMEDLLRNTLISLIEADLTLVDLPQFLINEDFRLNTLDKVKHPITKQYFIRFNNLSPKTRDEWMESTLNKVNAFLSDDRLREMFSFKKSSFSLRETMDKAQILLLKLDRGRLKGNADLIGSLFMTKIKLAAFSRSEIPTEQRIQFYLYIDEFQNFATKTFIELLSESRKYGLSLVLAHQNLSQLPEDLQDSILTNCGIQASFRISRKDAEIMAKEFFQTTGTEIKSSKISVNSSDYQFYSYQEEWERYFQEIQSLPNRAFYVKHKIEGGIIPLKTETIAPAYELAGVSKAIHDGNLKNHHFGLKYLSPRGKLQLPEAKEKDEKPENKQKSVKPKALELAQDETPPSGAETKSQTLEEITASLTPLEKAMLWAIGTGNYQASDIYVEANKKLKSLGASTRDYSEFKNKFYELTKLPPLGKGLVEFTKRGKGFCYWLSQWGEMAFADKFSIPSDRAINELGGGGKLGKAVSLELIKNWLEPEGYKVRKEDAIATDLNVSERGYTDLVAEKDGQILRIEIEHRTTKDQIEKNIRKNLEYSDILYEIASDETAKKKLIQVALKTMFRLRKEKEDKDLVVKIATIDELKKSDFKEWFEVGNG
ncbi:Type IV secretion-system coupling protein DNA-binding domain protein [uncultured archaeon]|nr:Type IV secretion-system coupling protein DNA-binding domain protein [uncultured archaeon]